MTKLVTIAVLMLSLTAATAQNPVPKKPYEQMTLAEVTRVLNDSPWTQRNYKLARSTRLKSDSPEYSPTTRFSIQIRLYSALPVRQALVRRMQLTIPYAELSADKRTSYDAEVDGLLKCPQCADNYIVTLSSAKGDQFSLQTRGDAVTLDTVAILKSIPEDELLRHVSIANDKGERRNAARVLFTKKDEAVFLFRRFDDNGKSLIAATNKKFYVDFDDYLSKKTEGALKKFTFKVRDIVQSGEVVF